VRSNGARELWWHNPTDQRWVVETDSNGMVIAAAGPFARDESHRSLRRHTLMDDQSAHYVREHRRDFVRLTAEIAVSLG
jgi:hypothetical protein